MKASCPHCHVGIQIDPSTLSSFAGRSHFNCPACQGLVALPARSKKLASAHSGINRNLLILGILALLVLGGIGFLLASRKSGDTNTTIQNIRNEIINNTYFQTLIATGATTKEDLEAIGDIRPYQDGFIGISKAALEWKDANTVAARTGAEVLEITSDEALHPWVLETFKLSASTMAWVLTRGDVGLLTHSGAIALKNADGVHKVLLYWKTSEQTTIDRSLPLLTSIGLNMLKVPGKDYYLGKTEVTQGQWETVMGNNPSRFKGEKLPVEQVNWHDAMDFCKRLTERERVAGRLPDGYVYTLPTKDQWEQACRAGALEKLASSLTHVAWFLDNSGGQTNPVATKRPNAWGFHDMHGNVSEWCLDESPRGGQGQKAYWGGSWRDSEKFASLGRGVYYPPDYRENYIGFRPAAIPVPRSGFDLARVGSPPQVGSNFRNGVGMELIWVKPNDVQGAEQPWNDDTGTTTLRIPNGFYLAATEVTQTQWEAVMGNNPSHFKGGDLPVEKVNWNQVIEFCAKLTERERAAGTLPMGYIYTLPTEVQWEYAYHAGGVKSIPDTPNEVSWYLENSGGRTHSVATKKPNAWGFYDMKGNVREWCLDQGRGPLAGRKVRATRGGDWLNDAMFFSRRGNFFEGSADNILGFRPVAVSVLSNQSDHEEKDEPPDQGPKYQNSAGLNMIWVKPDGKGSTLASDFQKHSQNFPMLRNSKGYYFGETEVTQRQWEAVMGDNPSRFKGNNLPVEQVTWKQAIDFCKRLTELERAAERIPKGFVYTLPYREQWEHASRVGVRAKGVRANEVDADLLDQMAWHRENSEGRTHPVATKSPNAMGFYDMHGNVSEWCLNRHARPIGLNVLRATVGGSWHENPAQFSSFVPDRGFSHIGFRIVAVRSNVLDRENKKEATPEE